MNNKNKSLYHFKATLQTDFEGRGKYKPYREIGIFSNQTLSTLAEVIVGSFNFQLDHCYGFYDHLSNPFKAVNKYELFTELDDVEHTPGAKGVYHTKLPKVFTEVGKKMLFIFDYGVNWEFIVRLTNITEQHKNNKNFSITKIFGKVPDQYPQLDYGDEKVPNDRK